MVDASAPVPPLPAGGDHEQRRLQAIMFTDMFGYSRMMGEDEARTIRLVEEHRAIVRAILPLHGGREHQTIGDAFVVLFDSALNAVSCAVAIQKRLRERNAALPEGEQIWIRIGIHLDDIVLRDGQIYGDGVNLAARVEPLAEKGGICVTEPVLRHVEGKVAFGFVALGEQALKNIARPPALYAVHVDGAPRPRPIPATKPPSRAPLVIAGLAVVAVVVTAVALRLNRPLAISEDPVAAAKYAEGLRRQLDMDIDGMNEALLAALARDDGIAGAHLRIATWAFEDTPLPAREHLVAAARHRDRLDEHDRVLLDTTSSVVGTVVDVPGWVEKSRAAFERFGSAEHRLQAARALHVAGRHAEARTLAEGGDVDAFLPLAWIAGMSALHEPGQEVAGVRHLQHCVDRGPSSTKCLLSLGFYQQRTGRCAEMEATARTWASRAPRDADADTLLAYALAARQAPIASVVETMKRAQGKRAEALRPLHVAMDTTRLAVWLGAFDEAEQAAREWLAVLGTWPDIAMQVMPNSYLVAVLLEQGRTDDAIGAAKAFLGRAPAFEKDAFGDDWTITFDNALFASGGITAAALEARRTTWLKAQRARQPAPGHLVHLWRDAWGEWARTPEQAALAKAAWDALVVEGLTVPPPAVLHPGLALAIGQMRLHTGEARAALPFLEQAATSCVGLLEPLRMTRAWLVLGQARAAIGDVDGARAAFQLVLDRWGDAGRSVTADAARAALSALPPPSPQTPPLTPPQTPTPSTPTP